MGLKSQKFYVYFMYNPMEPFISGVRPLDLKSAFVVILHPPEKNNLWACLEYVNTPVLGDTWHIKNVSVSFDPGQPNTGKFWCLGQVYTFPQSLFIKLMKNKT